MTPLRMLVRLAVGAITCAPVWIWRQSITLGELAVCVCLAVGVAMTLPDEWTDEV